MRLHPRTQAVQRASADIRSQLWTIQAEHDLTDVEMARVLLHHLEIITKYQLRQERHPGTEDVKADEDCGEECSHDQAARASETNSTPESAA